MKLLPLSVAAVFLFNSTIAFAENCPDDATWGLLKTNMLWTLTDNGAKQCYLGLDNKNGYERLIMCNHVFDETSTGMLAELKNCWPENVCGFLKANGAPGC